MADLLCKLWNKQPNSPQVYIGKQRVHHGEVGVLTGLLGQMIGMGTVLGYATGSFYGYMNFESKNKPFAKKVALVGMILILMDALLTFLYRNGLYPF